MICMHSFVAHADTPECSTSVNARGRNARWKFSNVKLHFELTLCIHNESAIGELRIAYFVCITHCIHVSYYILQMHFILHISCPFYIIITSKFLTALVRKTFSSTLTRFSSNFSELKRHLDAAKPLLHKGGASETKTS